MNGIEKSYVRMGDDMGKKPSKNRRPVGNNAKQEQLDQYRVQNTGKPMTTQEGKKITGSRSIKSRYPRSCTTARL